MNRPVAPRPDRRYLRSGHPAGIVLVGRWVDLSVMIYPPVIGDAPTLGVPEVAGIVAGVGIAVWLFTASFSRACPVPLRDPLLDESLHYMS